MILRRVILSLLLTLVLPAMALAAEQKFTIREDGLVRFKASVTGITRVSVNGDRIQNIVNDEESSAYQVRNDENTGDLFLRYVGPEGMPEKEGGYLVTEAGRTFAYEILPIRSSTQTVLITLKGTPGAAGNSGAGGGAPETSGFAETGFGTGDALAAQLAEATRATIAKKIRTSVPGSGASGAMISSVRLGELVGEVRVARAGKAPRQVREQEFYKPGVLSVWIQRKSLAAGERSWVVVVRSK